MINLFFILIIFIQPAPSEPYCSCLKPEPISIEEIEFYDLILKAEVSKITQKGVKRVLLLKVQEVYKGKSGQTEVEVVTNRDPAACGLTISTGDEWLIFAYKREDEYRTDSCSRSGNLTSPSLLFEKRRAKDLAFLEAIN